MSEHELWNELGNLYFMSGAYNQAIYAYHRSIQLDVSFGRPYSNLALAYVQQGKYQEAIELYRSSIELLADNKEKAISWSRLGNVYRHLKEYTQAVVAYQQADELDPQSTADTLPQTSAEILPQTTTEPAPQVTNVVPQNTEVLQQPDELMETGEEFAQIEFAALEPAPVEVNEEELIYQVSEAESSFEEEVAESPIDPALPEAMTLPSIEELWPGVINDPEPVSIEADQIEDDLVIEMGTLEEELVDSPINPSLLAALTHIPDEELCPGERNEPDPIAVDDSTASWALADPPRYQEDISESPKTGALTIWGEPDVDDEDWDLYPALDPEPDISLPDTEGDGLTRWIPIPEEEPGNEFQAFEQAEETLEEMPEPEEYESSFYRVIETVDGALSSSDVLPETASNLPSQCSEIVPDQFSLSFPLALPSTSSAHKLEEYSKPDVQLLDVEVEERPSAVPPLPEFVLAEELQSQSEETQAEPDKTQEDVRGSERKAEEMQEIEAGIAKFKRAVQTNPRNAYAWDALGTLYKSAGLYDDAIQAFQQATSINPPKALYFHNLGLVYACEGRDEDAIAAFQKVIEIDPDYSLAHATLGGYYRKMGQEELAQKHIGKAMKNIFDSENEYNRACLEAICGNKDHAIELLGVALRNKQTYVDWILRDPDLDFIRQDPRFKQLVSDYTR